MVVIDAVNEGINEGCDLHEDSNGGVNWYSGWDATLAPSYDNTYASTSPWDWTTTHGHGTGNTDPAWTTTGGDGNPGSTTAWNWGSVSTWASTTAWTWTSTTGNGNPGTWGSTPVSWTWPPGWTGSTPAPGVSWDPASWTWPPGWTESTPNPMDLDDLQAKMDEANDLAQEQLDQLGQAMDNANDLANQMAGDANDLANQLADISSDTMSDANDLANNLNSNMANLLGNKRKKRDTADDFCGQHEDNQVITYRHSWIYAVNVGTHKNPPESKKPRKSRLLSSTKGEENRIEL